jgi:hypothetical protein
VLLRLWTIPIFLGYCGSWRSLLFPRLFEVSLLVL